MKDDFTLQNSTILPARSNERLPSQEQHRLVAMLKAISHPMRFEILQFLLKYPNCYTKDIVDHLPISQATVSQHIKQLREAGWVASEAKCQMTCHWLDETNIAWFKDKVGEIF
ncbi:MAG: metalloregulator ArsR/SmtB family transcription factor [Chloroflexota bacterium]